MGNGASGPTWVAALWSMIDSPYPVMLCREPEGSGYSYEGRVSGLTSPLSAGFVAVARALTRRAHMARNVSDRHETDLHC